jgi:tetratricopeptide (TPR) repeat protein
VQLRADFVVWGSYRRAQGIVQVKSAMYGKSDGAEVAAAEVLTGAVVSEAELAGNVARKLLLAAAEKQTPPELAVAAAAWRQSPGFNDELITPVANIQEARTDLLAGFEALEQSLAYPLGSAEGKALLEQAEKKLKAATNQDPRNPLGHLALASCDFNWAQSLSHQGRKDEADAKAREYAEALKRAFRERDNTRDAHLKTEIQADHALLIKKDHAEAIRLYESLADVKSETRLHIALRAHWMLVGILSGDWGVDPSLTDPAKAREHIVQILAHWGDSSEAAYFKRQLRWDEEKGQNQFEHLPRENRTTLAALF